MVRNAVFAAVILLLAIGAVTVYLGVGTGFVSRRATDSSPTIASWLPDDILTSLKQNTTAQRIENTVDEYPLLVQLYGYPDSIISSENDSDKPLILTRAATYKAAGVNVLFAPIGCVDKFITALSANSNIDKHPAEAKREFQQLRAHPCKFSSGWTIVGYTDLNPDRETLTAERAATLLGGIKTKRTAKPIKDRGTTDTSDKKVDWKASDADLDRRQGAKDLCEIIFQKIGNDPIDAVAVKKVDALMGSNPMSCGTDPHKCISGLEGLIKECQRLGYYQRAQ
jgi:hypothetical protein